MAIPTAEGFEGYPATWFYLDREAGTLSEQAPKRPFAASDTVRVTLTPRFFNAPRRAVGATDQTQFLQQGKPNAYVKVQLDQDQPGTAMRALTYAALYPIVDNPNDDITSTSFTDPESASPIAGVPLPGGSGQFRTPVTAVVGGTRPKSSLLNIITQVIGFAGGSAVSAFFPIPAADLLLASNVESLVNGAATAFAPETKQQFWISNAAVAVAANQSRGETADSDVLQLFAGQTLFVVFPTGENGRIESDVKAISARPGLRFDMDRGGTLIALQKNTVVDPNPFANYLYITYRATVEEGT